MHQGQLSDHVHVPVVIKLSFSSIGMIPAYSETLESLDDMLKSIDIEEDPWIINMRSHPETCGSRKLAKAILKGETFVTIFLSCLMFTIDFFQIRY